ncbi:MAG: glycoside hydrolase [Myxococcota bacterium]|nr:glycoside hydrolase [Myxococcota bacterium]
MGSTRLPKGGAWKDVAGGSVTNACAVAVGGAILLLSELASANGRFPASNQIVFSPTDRNVVVARTTYGILPSRDNGATWSFLCEDALGLPSSAYQDPEIGLTSDNALVAGTQYPAVGLDVSVDMGCSWSCLAGAVANQSIADVVVRRDLPHTVLALASTVLAADAGGGYLSQVFQSSDDGAHWTALGVPLDPSALVQTIDVANGDTQRIYVSGTRDFGPNRKASLFVSTDGAAHWTERPLTAFDATTEDGIFIGAVDPTVADRVYLRSSALGAYDPSTGVETSGGQSRLFVTADAGQSFQTIGPFGLIPPNNATGGGILGFALSPDGSKIYAGTKAAGLFVATRADMMFRSTSSIHVQCLATRGAELWACSDAVSGFIVGVSTDDGTTFAAKMTTITSLAGPVACGADAAGGLACGATVAGSQCAEPFDAFCKSFAPNGVCSTDADGGDRATAHQPQPKHSSSGCSAAGGSPRAGFAIVSALAAMAACRARRISRAPRRTKKSGSMNRTLGTR